MSQPSLFDPPAAEKVEKPLTERQQFVLELVQHAGSEGLAADEVGARLCARRGKHDVDDRCQWCPTSGREVLKALRRRGLVKSRRNGSWYALEGQVEPELLPPGMTDEIPY